jgi:hypothetical protein
MHMAKCQRLAKALLCKRNESEQQLNAERALRVHRRSARG